MYSYVCTFMLMRIRVSHEFATIQPLLRSTPETQEHGILSLALLAACILDRRVADMTMLPSGPTPAENPVLQKPIVTPFRHVLSC